ncbi:hypothetical protein Ga0076813_14061 [endosymbiont of Ridgeia piscesae]|uniref:Uncharacterized protein n=1 Tax=endosymbiont of Ridgeia piscesae TaxID=54398 RepID=A0A0T5Z7E0_9GAMM|nr:hypothetical protein Ga0076813_14061 [endosymbiont of Ridgeia piscesae]
MGHPFGAKHQQSDGQCEYCQYKYIHAVLSVG